MTLKSKKAGEPDLTDVHQPSTDLAPDKKKKELTPAFLKHLHGQIKSAQGDLSLDDLKGMVAKSRAHAGGKMKAANRQSAAKASEGVNYTRLIEQINAELREEFSSPLYGLGCYPWAREVYDDHVIVSDDDGKFYSLPYATTGEDIEFGDPQEVEQTFQPIAAGEIIARCADGAGYRLFMEQQFVEPPEWLNYLPGPGSYTHPEYGKIDITEEGNKQFVDQFNEGIYQTYNGEPHVPIDAEHQTKLSGAVGWINELRVNDDLSVDAKTSWTERGQKLLGSDQYHFFSPEWYSEWTDPATQETYQNVAIGGAITTRPWFKEKGGLKPIIANEKGLQFGEIQKQNGETTIIFTALAEGANMNARQIEAARALVKAADAKTAGETLTGKTEADISAARALVAAEDKKVTDATKAAEDKRVADELAAKQATEPPKEFAERLATAEAEAKTFRESAEKNAAEAKRANERVDALEKDARIKRFTEIASKFVGDKSKHVARLETFAASEGGEDGDLFKDYVAHEAEVAAVLRESAAFKELGSAGTGDAGSGAAAEADAKAKKMTEDSAGKMTYAQAYSEVLKQDKKLYDRINKEVN